MCDLGRSEMRVSHLKSPHQLFFKVFKDLLPDLTSNKSSMFKVLIPDLTSKKSSV